MITSTKSNFFDYALLTFLILWSGGGFTYGLFPYWMLYALPFVGIVFVARGYRFSSSHWKTLSLLAAILVLQYLKFRGAPISIISPIMTMVICMMSSILLKESFAKIFVNIIYFFAISSLILWVISLTPSGRSMMEGIANGLPQLGWDNLRNLDSNTADVAKSIYLFTLWQNSELIRNSGPFWEPGRFVIFLIIALAVNLFYHKQNLLGLKNIIILVSVITTFSTTGYSALAVILIVYIIGSRDMKSRYKILLSVIILTAAVYVWQLDFMAEKINEQYGQVDVTYSRFGAIFYHWTQIVESPYIGYGPYRSIVIADLASSPNGLTDLMRYYGIPASIFLYILLFKGSTEYVGNEDKIIRIGTFIAILVLCFSQTITYSPFFYLLYFLALKSKK